jgi:hypothetical protein
MGIICDTSVLIAAEKRLLDRQQLTHSRCQVEAMPIHHEMSLNRL